MRTFKVECMLPVLTNMNANHPAVFLVSFPDTFQTELYGFGTAHSRATSISIKQATEFPF